MAEIEEVHSETYLSFLRAKRYSVILFDAPWDVGPGATIRLSFERTASALSRHANFGRINVDDDMDLARKIPIINVPTVAYYRDAQLVKALIGANQDVERRLAALMAGAEIGYDDGCILASEDERNKTRT